MARPLELSSFHVHHACESVSLQSWPSQQTWHDPCESISMMATTAITADMAWPCESVSLQPRPSQHTWHDPALWFRFVYLLSPFHYLCVFLQMCSKSLVFGKTTTFKPSRAAMLLMSSVYSSFIGCMSYRYFLPFLVASF